ncbi:hypothetical protein ACIQZG_22575 [Lysinibacillus sp. NPDC096418]|uniref:hypothetical protein n=1 Tax=Lysinibacillus sp. NPDC096418 TaxID=3364138 RepID=UPI003813AE18
MTNIKNQETKTQEQNFAGADTIRKCRICGDYMISGHIDEDNNFHYYCSKVCLDKVFSEEEQEIGYDNGTLYYTEWYDSEVFVVFDNQYAELEDAKYIKEKHGNSFTLIEVKTIDFNFPVFKIVDGEQIEIEELS